MMMKMTYHAEVGVDDAEEADASPEESGIVAPDSMLASVLNQWIDSRLDKMETHQFHSPGFSM